MYKLPAKFYWDHVYRDCASGEVVRQTKTHVYVELDSESYSDLLSDADYYREASMFDSYFRGLCASARATHAALVKVGAPRDL